MSKRQLVILFSWMLVGWAGANGLLPLLPVYATELGASSGFAGVFLGLAFAGTTAGTLSAGWVTQRLRSCKRPAIAACSVMVPLQWAMGKVSEPWQLTALTCASWYLLALAGTALTILAGLGAGKHERGKVFGVLGMASPVGAVIGGLTLGPIADRWGYPAVFTTVAGLVMLMPLIALLVKDATVPYSRKADRAEANAKLGWRFALLSAGALVVAIAGYVGTLGRSLDMKALGFSATAISSTGAVAGAVTIPLSLIAGVLSDRLGRRGLIVLGYLFGAASLVMLGLATSLWHFMVAMGLNYARGAVAGPVSSAFAADLVSRASLGRAISILGSATWVGGVVGFGVAGVAAQSLGYSTTFFAAAALTLVAVAMLAPLRVAPLPAKAESSPSPAIANPAE